MSNVAMLYHGNNEELHSAHRGWAETIGADLVSISETSPHSVRSFYQEFTRAYSIGEYDIVIAEGSRPLYTGAAHKAVHDSTLIYLCADHRLYQLWNSSSKIDSLYSMFKYILGTYGKPVIRSVSQRSVDGIIVISELVEEYLKPIFEEKVPTRMAHPYIQPGLYEKLKHTNPELDNKVAVTVGRPTRYKGVDMLIKAWQSVRERHPDAVLRVAGDGHPSSYEDTPGVSVLGFVDEIADAYKNAGLYVQPSRIEPFGVAVLEGLCAGLPAIVTKHTGTKSEIIKLSDQLISPTTAEGLSETISWYFDRSLSEKKELASAARERGNKFGPVRRKTEFEDAFYDLILEIRN